MSLSVIEFYKYNNQILGLELLVMEITLYARDGIKFFAIDSRMKIEVDGDGKDHQKTALISSKLSKLAQEKDIIIFLINQMSALSK
jgi:hypothetical protein